MRRFLFLLALLAAVSVSDAQFAITEFLASNSNGLQDELGNEEDWLEIQNTGAITASLNGWNLSDDPSNLRKWPIPGWTLAPGNRLVVFASNRNKRPAQLTAGQDNAGTPAAPRLATNFKLTTSSAITPNGYLALSQDQPGGGIAVISVYANYPKQVTDVSYGLVVNTTALVSATSALKALVPTVANGGSALGTQWRGGSEPFIDSAWASGTPGAGVAGTAMLSGGVKLRLNAISAAALTSDSSGAAHNAVNTSNTTIFMPGATDSAALLRRGAMQFAAASSSQLTIAAHTDFDSTSGTIVFWMKSAGMSAAGSEGAMLWDRRTTSGEVLVLMDTISGGGLNAGRLFSQPAGGGSFYSTVRVDDDKWHHVAFVFNRAAGGTDAFYIDGVARGSIAHGNAWTWPAGQQIELGRSHDAYWYKYNGLLDEVRFYNTALGASQIAGIYNGEDEDVDAADVGLSLAGSLPGNSGAFIRIPFTVANPANYSQLRLTSRSNDGFVAYINGTKVDALNAPAAPVYNSLATTTALATRGRITDITTSDAALVAGTNYLAIHAMNNSTSDPNFLALHTLDGVSFDPGGNYLLSNSPGAANSGVRTNIGPFITDVTGDSEANLPVRPAGGAGSAAIVVTAKVTASLRALASPVQLAYLTMFGSETVVNMTLTATANVYTASVPTTQLAAGQMLRWRIVASDTSGIQSTAPSYLRPADSDKYYGTVAVDGINTKLPIYHVFVPGTYAFNNSHVIDQDNVGGRASFFYDGELYDNVFIRIKGDTTRTLAKRAHRVDFNSDHQLRWAAGQKRLRELALNADYIDPSYSRQFMSMWLHRVSGTGAPNYFSVRCQINGQFWQLASHTETQDSELLDFMGLDPNGAMYCSVGQMGGAAGEKQTRTTEGNTDMASFVSAISQANLATRENNVFDQIDIPAVVNYIAVARLTQEGDDVWANMVIHRDSDRTGEWRIVPFDTNLSWGQLYYGDYTATHANLLATDDTDKCHPLYGNASCYTLNYAGVRYNRFYDAIISVPRTRAMLKRRIRTLMDTYLQAPGTAAPFLEAQLDAHVALIAPEVALDRAKWGWPAVGGAYGLGNEDFTAAISKMKNNFIVPRRAHFFNTHTSTTNVGITNASSAGLPAAPQPAIVPITIAGYDYNPTDAGRQDAEWIQLTNPNAFDADLSGWRLTGAVAFTFNPGTVLNAGASLYVSPKQQAFRARATSPRGAEGRFVVGPYDGQISARGETIELRDATGSLVASAVTPSNPTAGQQQLRITELNFNPSAPSAGELAALPGVGASDFEWIELFNSGAGLNIGNTTFTKGITFTFPAGYTIPAGARVVLVANQAAFIQRYGTGVTIAGVYAGNLDNSGEELELVDPVGEVVLDFRYENSWYPPADGAGRTLAVRAVNPSYATYGLASHWALSATFNGTPGVASTDFANHYDGWRWDHFTEAEIYLPSSNHTANPATVGLMADLDHDGLTNLAEYAFGGNPREADRVLVTVIEGAAGPHLLYRRRHNALDLVFLVERSVDLVNWSPATGTQNAVFNPADETENVEFTDSQPAIGKQFYRVRAVKE